MFVLMCWILIIEVMTAEIKIVYGIDRVIIAIPLHVKKMHRTKTIYKIVEKPVRLQTNSRFRTTRGGESSRPVMYVTTHVSNDMAPNGAQRHLTVHADRGAAGTPLVSYRDHGHDALSAAYGLDHALRGQRGYGYKQAESPQEYSTIDPYNKYGPYKNHGPISDLAHKPYGGGGGDTRHGHYGKVVYVGDHKPVHFAASDQKPGPYFGEHNPPAAAAYYNNDYNYKLREYPDNAWPEHGADISGPGAAHVPPTDDHQITGSPVTGPQPLPTPPPPPHDFNTGGGHGQSACEGGGYHVHENHVDYDGQHTTTPPPPPPDPLPYITVSPSDYSPPPSGAGDGAPTGDSLDGMSSIAAISAPRNVVRHVYYTLDPVVPYDDIMRPPK